MKISYLTDRPGLPKTRLPFSPAVLSDGWLFISGQASTDGEGNIVAGDFETECRRSFDNLGAVLLAAGCGFRDVVQVRNYIGDKANLQAFNRIYKEYFSEPYPARTTLVGCLGGVLQFEVEAVARVKS